MSFSLGRVRPPSPASCIAVLALAVAMTGTAVAATGTVVNIADGTTAANLARVDAGGSLKVGDGSGPMTVDGLVSSRAVPPAVPLNYGAWAGFGTYPILGPTTATLAITRLSIYNTALNTCCANTNLFASLMKGSYDSTNGCRQDGARMSALRVPVGSTQVDDYSSTPLVFKSSGGASYCVMVSISAENSSPTAYYSPFVQLTGYVVSGTYTGAGTSAAERTGTSSETSAKPPFRTAR